MNAVDLTLGTRLGLSLPMIALNVVIHALGLALFSKSGRPDSEGAMERHRFMPTFAVLWTSPLC